MAEQTEVPAGEGAESTGADDSIPVNETVDGLVESLNLVEPKEEKDDGQRKEEGEAKDAATSAPPAEGQAEGTVKGTEGAAPKADAPIPSESEVPPDTWRKEAKELWKDLPASIRAEVVKREGDISRFVGEAQPSFQIAQMLHKTVEPYLPMMQRYGVDPIQHLGALLSAHTTLLFGAPEVKAQMFRNLAQQAGIDLPALAANPNATAEANTQQLAYVRALEERLARMEQGVTGVTNHIQESRVAELEQGIVAFANDATAHPFFWELAQTGEIKNLIDAGAAKTLKDAYELAVYRNPVTRQKQLALESTRQAQEAAKASATKVAAARKATGANVRSRGSGKVGLPLGESIEDTLRSTLSEIRERTH